MIDRILIGLGTWLLNKGHAVLFVVAQRRGCEFPMATVRGATIKVLLRHWWIDGAGQLVPPIPRDLTIVYTGWPESDCGDPSGLPAFAKPDGADFRPHGARTCPKCLTGFMAYLPFGGSSFYSCCICHWMETQHGPWTPVAERPEPVRWEPLR